MYSLEINFLKDRIDEESKKLAQQQATAHSVGGAMMITPPFIAGVVVMVLLPAISGVSLWLIKGQTTEIGAQIQQVDAEIAQLQGSTQQVEELKKQLEQSKAQTEALVSVFKQIKPWSAVLQDIRDRTPTGVRIESVSQTEVAAAAPAPAEGEAAAQPASPPTAGLSVTGYARSFSDVNNFLLTLQDSRFLSGDKTVIEDAKLVQNPTQVEFTDDNLAADITVTLPEIVQYTIKTEFNTVPASDLIQELSLKGATGLVTRIRTLEQKGAIQP